MSTDYYMVCHECKQAIHIAQDGLSGWTFYRGEPNCMRAFGKFLEAHSLHADRVSLAPEQRHDDYTEVEWSREPQFDGTIKNCGSFPLTINGVAIPPGETVVVPVAYWLCCGSIDPGHRDQRAKGCIERERGHPERCRFGTREDHMKPVR